MLDMIFTLSGTVAFITTATHVGLVWLTDGLYRPTAGEALTCLCAWAAFAVSGAVKLFGWALS